MIYVHPRDTMSLILNRGHSRVPIYSGSLRNIIGLILVRAAETLMVMYCLNEKIRVSTMLIVHIVVILANFPFGYR